MPRLLTEVRRWLTSPPQTETAEGELRCPNCLFVGRLFDEFDIGGLPDGIVICNRCLVTIEVETGERYDGPLDESRVSAEVAGQSTGDASHRKEQRGIAGQLDGGAGRVVAAGAVTHKPKRRRNGHA